MIQGGLRPVLGGTRRCLQAVFALIIAFSAVPPVPLGATSARQKTQDPAAGISKSAADSCDSKVQGLEAYAAQRERKKENVTKFSIQEVNSYLALDLSSKYSPSLKSVVFAFGESELQGSAVIDFDQLGANSKKFAAKLFAGMFSGIHTLMVRGRLIANGGKASFELKEARFDNNPLPNFLVAEIITAVGRKQRPPFDPMMPSQMPYHIDRVELHRDYILVYQ